MRFLSNAFHNGREDILLFRPKFSGNPKYLPVPPSYEIRRALLVFSRWLHGVFEEKLIDDLVWLMHCPYLWSIPTNILQLDASDLQKNIVSSAKRRWLTRGIFMATRTPGSDPFSCAFRQRLDKTSVQMMKRYGDRKSPCLIPREGRAQPCGTLLKRKE